MAGAGGDQLTRVVAVGSANHDDDVALAGQIVGRLLALLGGLATVSTNRTSDWESAG